MKVEIFGKEWCAYCDRAKELLDERKVPYEFYDVENSVRHHKEMMTRNPDAKTVPQVFIDGKLVGGYDQLRARFKAIDKETDS